MSYFLDTNICSYYLKGKSLKLKDKLKNYHPFEIKIPAIVKAELYYGAKKGERTDKTLYKINNFLLPFQIIFFGEKEAEVYGEIRALLEERGEIIGPNDLIIASIVLANNGILVTNNEIEFKRVNKLKISNWVK